MEKENRERILAFGGVCAAGCWLRGPATETQVARAGASPETPLQHCKIFSGPAGVPVVHFASSLADPPAFPCRARGRGPSQPGSPCAPAPVCPDNSRLLGGFKCLTSSEVFVNRIYLGSSVLAPAHGWLGREGRMERGQSVSLCLGTRSCSRPGRGRTCPDRGADIPGRLHLGSGSSRGNYLPCANRGFLLCLGNSFIKVWICFCLRASSASQGV